MVTITNNSISDIFCFSLLEDSLKQFSNLYNLELFVSNNWDFQYYLLGNNSAGSNRFLHLTCCLESSSFLSLKWGLPAPKPVADFRPLSPQGLLGICLLLLRAAELLMPLKLLCSGLVIAEYMALWTTCMSGQGHLKTKANTIQGVQRQQKRGL